MECSGNYHGTDCAGYTEAEVVTLVVVLTALQRPVRRLGNCLVMVDRKLRGSIKDALPFS